MAPFVPVLMWMPAVATMFLGLRALAHHVYSIRLTGRFDRLQQEFRVPEEFRWKNLTTLRWAPSRAGTAYAVWLFAQVITILVPAFVALPRP